MQTERGAEMRILKFRFILRWPGKCIATQSRRWGFTTREQQSPTADPTQRERQCPGTLKLQVIK